MVLKLVQYVTQSLWIVSGCLKLLPYEELQHLDIPIHDNFSGPVKNVVYISEKDTRHIGENITLSGQHTEGTRFNLFTGHQTFDQRERSFKVISYISKPLALFKIK